MHAKKILLLITCICTIILWNNDFSIAQEKQANSEVFQLGEVVVSEKRETINLATTITEVTEQDIISQGAQTVAEALNLVPGLYVEVGGKNEAKVQIRGFTQKDIKILIDGVRAQETHDGSLDLSLIPVDAIAKITITKGASSVLYGANAMGGVINIITKKGGKKPVTEFTTSFGDYDTRNYILNHGASAGNFNYWITYGYRESDGYRLSDDFDVDSKYVGIDSPYHEDGGKRNLSDYIKRTLNAKIGYEADKDTQIYFTFDYHNNERGVASEFDRYWEFTKWDQWSLNLVGETKIAEMLTLKGRIFYVDHENTIEDVIYKGEKTSKKWFERSAWDDYSIGGELHTFFNLSKKNLLKIGLNYVRDQHKQQDLYDDDSLGVIRGWDTVGYQPEETYRADTYTVALEDEIYPTDKLSFVFGLSYDYFDPKKAYNQPVPDEIDSINPQAGVVFHLADTTDLHASVGKKTRFPKLGELYSEYAGGNPDLDPQQTIAYEIGAEHYFTPNIRSTVACFYNDIEDLIERVASDPTNNKSDKIYVNIGEARTQGVEATLDVNITNDFFIGTNYTYLDAKDEINDRELQNQPKHRINLALRYRAPFGLTTNIQGSYTIDQVEYDNDDQPRDLDDYILVNARFSQKAPVVRGLNSELFFEIKNIFDEYYDYGRPMPGRNFLAGLTLKY